VKIIHTADWHLAPARTRIDPETGRNARLEDFARCAKFTIEDGIARGAELILHAGDAFSTRCPTPTEVWLFRKAIAPAQEAHVPILLILGNHEATKNAQEKHALDLVRETEGLTVVDRPCLVGFYDGLIGDVADFRCSLQVACLPWPMTSLLLRDEETRKLAPGDRNLLIREKVMDVLHGLAAELRPGIPSVLLAHISLDMAAAGAGDRLMLLGSDWTLSAAAIAALGFDYVALGHIHKPQMVFADENGSPVWYCGSPEAVTAGEESDVKGYNFVCMDSVATDGRYFADVRRIATPFRRFCTVDVAEGVGWGEWPQMQDAIVRLRIPQAMAAEATQLRTTAEGLGALEVTVEIIRAEAERRAGALEVSAGMEIEPAIRTWAAQRPDLEPLVEGLVAEGLAIEAGLKEAA
jgi:exonuclease SbcD